MNERNKAKYKLLFDFHWITHQSSLMNSCLNYTPFILFPPPLLPVFVPPLHFFLPADTPHRAPTTSTPSCLDLAHICVDMLLCMCSCSC